MDCTHELSGPGQGWHYSMDTVQIDIRCWYFKESLLLLSGDPRYEWVQAPLITCQSSLNSCCWAISVQIFVIACNWQTGDFCEAARVIFATFCEILRGCARERPQWCRASSRQTRPPSPRPRSPLQTPPPLPQWRTKIPGTNTSTTAISSSGSSRPSGSRRRGLMMTARDCGGSMTTCTTWRAGRNTIQVGVMDIQSHCLLWTFRWAELAGPDSRHGLYRGFRDLPCVRSVGGAPQEVLGEESQHTEEISVSSERGGKYLWV